MPGRAASLGEAFNANRLVRIYGRPIQNFPVPPDFKGGDFAGRGTPSFAFVRAFAVGSICRVLPMPVVLLVPGAGEDVQQGDKCGIVGEESVWSLLTTEETVVVSTESGNVLDLLDVVEAKGIDGGLQIENPRFANGQLCATIHAWAKIEVFGKKVGFDERIPVCIPLQGCYPVWSIDIARIEVCFRAPSELCARLCVGKWGLEKCWDACAHIPLAVEPARFQSAEAGCGCSG